MELDLNENLWMLKVANLFIQEVNMTASIEEAIRFAEFSYKEVSGNIKKFPPSFVIDKIKEERDNFIEKIGPI